MSTVNVMSFILSILHVQAITVHACESTTNGAPQGEGKEAIPVRLATRAEGGGGGVNIGAVIGAIAGVILILGALLLIYLKSRNRNPNQNQSRTLHNNYPSQKQSIFTLGSYKQPPQPLPLYTQPTSPYAQHYNGGLPMPQAVHPSTSGYYRQAGQVQQDNGVRFGGVGVVRY